MAGHIADEGVTPLSDAFYDGLFSRAARKGPRPEWLALIKEPPMRSNSHVAVGSPTVRVVAILAATLLLMIALAAAGAGFQRLLAAGPIVVAADGSGDYTTIQAAVDAAEDGYEILVRPDTYVESVLIHQDITIRGDGARDQIVVVAPEDPPTAPISVGGLSDPYAIRLEGSDATVSGLTVRGEDSQIHLAGGSPHLEDVVVDGVGRSDRVQNFNSVIVSEGSTATIASSLVNGGSGIGIFDKSEPLIENNELLDAAVWGYMGDDAVIRGNTFEIGDPPFAAIGIFQDTTALVENNTFSGAGIGVEVGWGAEFENVRPTIRNNEMVDSEIGVSVAYASPVVEDNVIANGRVGVSVSGASFPEVNGNRLTNNETGFRIISADPIIEANEVVWRHDGHPHLRWLPDPGQQHHRGCGARGSHRRRRGPGDGRQRHLRQRHGRPCQRRNNAGPDRQPGL